MTNPAAQKSKRKTLKKLSANTQEIMSFTHVLQTSLSLDMPSCQRHDRWSLTNDTKITLSAFSLFSCKKQFLFCV
jgi:hypothetical protein